MYKIRKGILCFIILSTLVSCSTKRNTAITRSYHNITSRYNILFNGKESYKSAMDKLLETYDDDFTQMLPVFLYTDENALSSISSEMDRTIKKSTKLISMHSLTVKPKIKPDKELSPRQKEFYSKKEYNKYVDEAYLLMGKAHFHKKEYSQAKQTFNYILANYPDDISVYEARIWLARLANEEGRYREANDILSSLSKNLEFPKKLQGELDVTLADYYIKQKRFQESTEPLLEAIENSTRKRERIRLTYLLAQIYAEIGESTQATRYYGKVIQMNPPYTMTFNAKINQALTYQQGSGSRKDIEKQLRKMLKDDKNIEYQDQIYYALGNLYFRDNLKKEAIENYILSIQNSTDNQRQKAKSSLTLADIYYDQPDYMLAQAYYDSAVSVINTDYPNYQEIYTKSISLNKLVESVRTVEFEDSVLKLAAVPEPELMAMIDEIIEKEILAEQERKRIQQEEARDKLESMAMQNEIARFGDGGKWYFYNPTAKNLGRKEFFQVWGNRKLEDNWRRKNKSTVSFDNLATGEEGEEEPASNEEGRITNFKTREFYLQDIPFSDSAKEASLERIRNGLYEMGVVYGDELKDYPEAIIAFEKLLSRFPDFHDRLIVYYKLHTIAREVQDIERVSKYQQKIVTEFPNSNFAKLMTNPNYIKEIEEEEKGIIREYERIREMFDRGSYTQVIPRINRLIEDHPDHELRPKFDYIATVSAGLQKDTLAFIRDLRQLIVNYPSTDIAVNAQKMISYLEDASPKVVQQQTLEEAREIYVPSRDETHFFMFIAPSAININQLIFNLISFNLDNYDRYRLEVKRVGLEGKKQLCVVQKFNLVDEALEYLDRINREPDIFRDVEKKGVVPVIISRTNFNKLKETNKADEYILFFSENY